MLQPEMKDPQRMFGALEREIIYYRDRKRCGVCDADVVWSEAEIHHIDQHSQGGQTTLENGVLVHRHCHPKGAEASAEHAASTAIEALDEARPAVVQLGEVRREGHVVELAAVEPGVEPPERARVGAARVRADGGLDQAARGLCRTADRGLFGVDPGGTIIHVNGNYRPSFGRLIVRASGGASSRRPRP